jgi:hypothetical protein
MKMLQIEKIFADDAERQNIEIASLFKKDFTIPESIEIANSIKESLKEAPRHIRRFKMAGRSWGFIPNLDKISTAEYLDIKLYGSDPESYHKLLAILYRPVKKKISFRRQEDLYSIEDYDGVKYDKEMKEASLEVLFGALSFFFLLSESLKHHLISSMTAQSQKLIDSISEEKKNLV